MSPTPTNDKGLEPTRPGRHFILLLVTAVGGFSLLGCQGSLDSQSDAEVSASEPLPSFGPAEPGTARFDSPPSMAGMGACCIGDRCEDSFPDICVDKGGVFRGVRTTCAEDPCVTPPAGLSALLGDCDQDGQTDLEELLQGIDPCDPQHDWDIDNDGIPNEDDFDIDGDGVPNAYDRDVDGDGLHNSIDRDIDGDGIPNDEDDDADGDGVPDDLDNDDDADGKDDEEDEDDDDDCEGIEDCEEGQTCRDGKCVDFGKCKSDSDCSDPDETCSDGECIDPVEFIRFLFDEEEEDDLKGSTCGLSSSAKTSAKCDLRFLSENDMDGDGVLDFNDSDMDGDGIPNTSDSDIDGDGIPNRVDPDIDGDGIPNNFDDDDDGDGIPDDIDSDANGDGVPD